MSNNYVLLIIAWVLGQFGYASVSVARLQKNLVNVEYFQAWLVYVKKETGSFVMAFAALLIMLFIFPDFFDPTLTKAAAKSKEVKTFMDYLVIWQRTAFVFFGGFSQHLLYLGWKKGKAGITELDKKNAGNPIP